ncbi:MAG: hypothetical protein KDK90_12585 [Leptospiraceae bacterium]|nr:hypothetical protein [Leptospiraceae bacterium]
MHRLKTILILFLIVFQFTCLKFYLRDDIDESQVLILTKDDLKCIKIQTGKNEAFYLEDWSSICKQFGRKEIVYIKYRYNGFIYKLDEIWCK